MAQEAHAEFGGLFMDHQAGGVLVVSFTGRAEEHLAELRALFPFPERLQARTVAFTEQRLRSAVDLLTDRLGQYEAAGFEVGMIIPDISSNSVQVGGVGDVAAGAEAMAASVPADMLEVVVEPLPVASNRDNNYPLKGGLRITRPSSPGFISVCSSAFVAYYDSGSIVRRVRNYTLLTAGHCGAQGDDYTHGGRVFGEVIRDQYPGNAVTQDCDCMAISMNSLNRSNSVYVTASTAQPMARAQSEGERVIGEPTRLSGVTSGIQDGTLLATGVTVNYAGTPPFVTSRSRATPTTTATAADRCMRAASRRGSTPASRRSRTGPAGQSSPRLRTRCGSWP